MPEASRTVVGGGAIVRVATSCRYCGSADLRAVLSLGSHPPSNSFLHAEDVPHEERYPLEVVRCGACALVQLGHTVDSATIFDRYLYLSSSSAALRRHFAGVARELSARFDLRPGDLIVDIGCNDGVLLREFDPRLTRIGVEPSTVAEIARREGLEVVQAYFGPTVADDLRSAYGTARLVTATNVFAHVDRIGVFAEGLRRLLGDRGVFVAEMSYLPSLVDGVLFDTIYHEHVLYLALTPMVPFLAAWGLHVFDVELIPFGASGPAFRVYCAADGSHPPSAAVEATLRREDAWGIRSSERYDAFAGSVTRKQREIRERLDGLRARGARIGGYGAPAKGNTLLNTLEIDRTTIEMIAETNPLKQGLLTPGSHIPIVSEERFLQEMPGHALLLSWNYVDYLLEHSEYIRRGGKFLVPLPDVRLAPT